MSQCDNSIKKIIHPEWSSVPKFNASTYKVGILGNVRVDDFRLKLSIAIKLRDAVASCRVPLERLVGHPHFFIKESLSLFFFPRDRSRSPMTLTLERYTAFRPY